MEGFKSYLLSRHVLDKQIADIGEAIRDKRKLRLPVVLTKPEITRLFEQMSGTNLLMAKIIYGCGLRLRKCTNLRIKDIEFSRMTVTVRSKGDKDSETVLPGSIKDTLRNHIEYMRKIYEKDSDFSILKLCRIRITIKFKHKVERITFLLYKNLI